MSKKELIKEMDQAFEKWFTMPMDGLSEENKETFTKLAKIAFFNGAYWAANEIKKIT